MTLPGGAGESGPQIEQASKAKQTGSSSRRGSSGRPALVTMMNGTDLRDRDNRAGIGRLHVARFRAMFLQC